MSKKTLIIVLLSCAVLLGATAYGSWHQFYGDAVPERFIVRIGSDADYRELEDTLMRGMRHRRAFRFYADRIGLEEGFKPGNYEVREGMTAIEVARMFKLGKQRPVQVTLNNIRTKEQLAARLARQLEADSAAWMEAFRSPEVLDELNLDTLSVFMIFLPDTYEAYWTESPRDFILRMRHNYNNFWYMKRDKALLRTRLTREEAMVLASIVTEETNKKDEMSRIAGVYINRLRKGMPLQADPTVKYALRDFGLRRILYKHLKTPSPYNTYINKGLPPSVICMPELAAIDAVLLYEEHDYLYFCARPMFDGYHNFARTLAEHNANARAYSHALNERKIR